MNASGSRWFVSFLTLLMVTSGPVQQVHAQGAPLTLGGTNSGTISLPGQEDRFTFTGAAGQRLYFDALDLDSGPIYVTLTSPGGDRILSLGSVFDSGLFYLTETGTYRLGLDGSGDATGSYSFRLVDLASATPVTYGQTYAGQLSPRSRMQAYRFEGTVGQRLNVESLSASTPGEGIWHLYSPANVALLTSYGLENSPGEVMLPSTGTYLLLAVGTSENPGPLDFQFRVSLVSNPSGGTSGFGIVRAGLLLAGQTNTFTYTGPAGLPVYLDALTNNSAVTMQLFSPVGELMFNGSVNSDTGVGVLPRSGTYTMKVIAETSDAEYLFRFLDLNASAIPITNGTVYAQAFDSISTFRCDVYRFTGAVGQRFYHDSLEYDFDGTEARLYGPDGQVMGNFPILADYDAGPLTLPFPGIYYVAFNGSTADPNADYHFRWLDVSQVPATSVSFDTTIHGSNTLVTAASLYRFNALTGQRLYFDGAATNQAGTWNLYGPTDTALAGNPALNGDFEVTLPGNGQYVLAVGNAGETNTASFSFRIITPETTNANLTLGVVVSGELSEPGEEDRYTFAGTAGQKLYYDALGIEQLDLSVILLDPVGNVVHLNSVAYWDYGPFTLPESATYTLVLKARTEVTGSYRFRLLDVTQPPSLTVGFDVPVTGSNSPASAATLYRFNGTAGQRLFFDATGTNAGGWSLFRPDGFTAASGGLAVDFEVTLPMDGIYTLVAGNLEETNAASFSFRIITPTTTTNALALGTTVNGTLDEPGEEDRFTFTGTTGQRLYYDALQSDFQNLTVYLLNPAGNNTLLYQNADSETSMLVLTESGTWTLVLKATSDFTGSYSFRLLDLATSPLLAYGNAVTNQLSPHLESDLYRLNGTAGQRIVITNLLASDADANWYLYAPNNTLADSDNIASSLGELVLPVTGTYGLLVVGAPGAGALDYAFRADLVSGPSGSPSGFGVAHSGSTSDGQTNSFSYSGPAGRAIYFDSLTNDSPATVRLIGPASETVFHSAGSLDAGPFFLPRNGSYTLEVVGTGEGSFDFRLLDCSSEATAITFGTTYSQSLTPPLRTDLYRFEGSAGQRIYYDAELLLPAFQVQARFYSPSGVLLDSDLAGFEKVSLVLTEAGTYYLAMAGTSPTVTSTYAFRILDAAQPPATVLPLDTIVTGNLNPGTRVGLYRLNGTAGQRLFFNAPVGNSVGVWYLFGPDASLLGGGGMWSDFEVTLPVNGQYVLSVGNSLVEDPLAYSFEVITPTRNTNALALGQIISGSLSEIGEEDWFAFTVSAGQRVYYDSLDPQSDNIMALLFDAVGNVMFYLDAESDSGPVVLAQSGTCYLRLKDASDGTGNYSFRLLDTATAATLPYDTVITGSVTNSYGAQLFQVPVTESLHVIVDGLSPVDGLGVTYFYDPRGSLIGVGSFGQDMDVTPMYSGTDLLVLMSTVSTNLPYSFQIIPGNHAPVLAAIGNRTNNEITLLTFTASAADLEAPNDQLTFTLDPGAPAAASINPVTGVFSWTPDETNGPGVYPVTVRVTDNGIPNFNDFEAFNITVHEVNRTPLLTVPGDQIVSELVALNLSASATDPDVPTNALTFSLLSPPSGMTINANSGAIAWTPSEAQGPFTNTVTVVVTDTNPPAVNAKQLSATNTFQITVNEVNVAPTPQVQTNRTINELTLLTVTNTATDSDLPANGLSYVLTVSPPGATISTNGIITWTPTEAQGPSTNIFTTVVTDTNLAAVNTQNLTATNTFTVFVNEVNTAPTLPTQTNRTIAELMLLTVINTASDGDSPANGLGYVLTVFPPGATISSNGVISWTPTEAQGPSTNTFTTIVTDTNLAAVNTQNLTATNTFTVFVNEVNTAPTLPTQTDRTITELTLLTVTNAASDGDSPANGLGYVLTVFPPGATISSSGVISWTPTEAQGPSANIFTTVVTDTNLAAINSQNLTATNTFTVFVNESNVAPVLTLPPSQAINELVLYANNATATDADSPANLLLYALVSGPPGLTVSSAGAVAWTPTEAQGPGVYPVEIKVTDTNPPAVNTTSLSVTGNFTLTVNEVNLSPTLLPPTDRTLHAGIRLSASALATDPDVPANTFTYAKVSGPAGVTVSAGGLIRWNTSDADASTTNLIALRVTDSGTPGLSDTNSFVVIVDPRPHFTSITRTGSVATAVWTAIPGTSYRLQYKTNLSDTVWGDLAGDVTAGSVTASKTDPTLGTNATRFYRVFVLP